jgi:outer membrane protein assembly factor BamB
VLITIECPICETKFQVDASLRGRQIRCPKADCREVFEVREVGPAPEPVIEGVPLPSPPPSQKTGRVGDMVPVVGAEAAAPPPPPPDWRAGPPPRRGDGATPPPPPPRTRGGARSTPPTSPVTEKAPPRRSAPASSGSRGTESKEKRPKKSAGPVELPPGEWDAPPVRRGTGSASSARSRTSLEMDTAERTAQAKKRRHTRLMLGIVTTILLLLGVGLGVAWLYLGASEQRDREAAEKFYAEGHFDKAGDLYHKLVKQHPDSPNQDDYRFMEELNAVRFLERRSDTKGAFDRIGDFLKERKDHPHFAEHGKEVGETLMKVLGDASKAAEDNLGDPEAQAHYQRGRQVLDELLALNGGWAPKEEVERLEEKDREIARRVKENTDRLDLIARLRALAEKPSAAAILKMREALRQEARFNQDPEVKKAEDELNEKLRDSVVYTEDEEPLPAGRRAEDYLPGLVVSPLLGRPSDDGPRLPTDRVVFALARGVLYALRQSDGDVLWAMRVGIDTAHLPLRVPPSGNTPELALVLSADTLTLTAVNARTNEMLWEHRMGAATLGRPVIVDRRVYVPTLNGEVHEIELAGGNLLGRYKLGQSLSVGGARFGDTKQIFFPGDESCVYVLDVEKRQCQTILYTDHEAGLLRGEPILLPSEDDPAVPGYLVLSQAHGLDSTLLRTFRLMPADPAAAPGAKESRLRADPVAMPDRRLRGWPWFPPFRDPEKLVTVTDAGVLGLFGIVQAHNKDDALFPLIRLPDTEEGTIELTGHGTARGRAQVVHAQDSDLWVLARGRLLRYSLALDETGPRVLPDLLWKQPLDLGSPLHESQSDDDGTTFFLVTQSTDGHACLATAVDAKTGHVRWQRQLGLVCHGDPQPLGDALVTLDQGGGLFLFDPAKHPTDVEEPWQSAGYGLARPLPEGVTGSVYLVPGPDGKSVYEFASPESGNHLTVRVYHAGDRQASEHTLDLPSRLVGTPAVGETRLLLPLADGATRQVRLPLGMNSVATDGPPWRASRNNAAAGGHVVWLGGDDFLMSNGQRGLTRWSFGKDDLYFSVPDGRGAAKPTLELTESVAGAPVVLTRAGSSSNALSVLGASTVGLLASPLGQGPILTASALYPGRTSSKLRVCVADDKGTVYLFEDDALKQVRRWELKEALTAGPFVRGGQIGCVVGRRRLVWLDPAKDDPLWTYESPGEGIVGRPQLADGLVLVADVSGRFVALDPLTGRARGPGYQLRGSVGPAAAPVGFGSGRAFAPMTDGTVLFVPLHHLREPLPGLPPLW